MTEDVSDRDELGRGPAGPIGAEPSAADASRQLANRLARESSVIAHGTIPFRSGPEPEPGRSRGKRIMLAVAVVLAVLAVVIVVALVVS